MPKRIYITNLPSTISTSEIKTLCSKYGKVISVKLISDRVISRNSGSAYVEMESGADKAIMSLSNTQIGGKILNVNEA